MNCYKLNYSCSKKRIDDLIHKGLEYEKEHNIEQPEKDRIIDRRQEQITNLMNTVKALQTSLNKACRLIADVVGDCPVSAKDLEFGQYELPCKDCIPADQIYKCWIKFYVNETKEKKDYD